MNVSLELPAELVEAIAERAAEMVLERLAASEPSSAYMSVREAADYLRAKPQRVHDLLSAGKLTRFKEGARTLVARREVEALVRLERRAR